MIAANRVADMHITASSATDIYYLIRKHLYSTEQSKLVMSKLYELFYILDVTGADCLEALSCNIKDYEDAVVSCCLYKNQMQYIVTRNVKDYEQSKVPAILPDEFIMLIMEDEE